MSLAVIGIGEKGLIRRTLLLKRLDRLRLMLLKLRTRVFQDGYVFLQPVASYVITSTPSQPSLSQMIHLHLHLIQCHIVPSQRHLTQSSSSSRCPPLLPTYLTSRTSLSSFSRAFASRLKSKLTTRAHGAEKEPRNPVKTPPKNPNS